MRCIAIDDEPIALAIIKNFCDKNSDIELEVFTNPILGMEALKKLRPDVLFLDIEMNDFSGIELAKQLPNSTILIFTTAHANYALNGFEVNALDFLHKPFSYERFENSLSRVRHILEIREKAKDSVTEEEKTITIKVDYQNITIGVDEICYIEAMDNYIKIFTLSGKVITTKMGLKYFIEMLPSQQFIRIHRSFVVAKSQIESYSRQAVKLTSKDRITLPVGRIFSEQLFKAMVAKK